MTKPRIWSPGSTYHVATRGNRRQAIFVDRADYIRFLRLLIRMTRRHQISIYAFCLMPNHLHLLLSAPQKLDPFMRDLLGAYAAYFNEKYEHVGHLFQGPYLSRIIGSERYFWVCFRYIHRNPVKAGLVKDSREWPWSSVHEFHGILRIVSLPFGLTQRDMVVADADGLSEGDYITEIDAIPAAPLLEMISDGFPLEDIRSRSRKRSVVQARRELVRRALDAGVRAQDVAAFLGISRVAVYHLAAKKG